MKALKFFIPKHITTDNQQEFSNKMKELHKIGIRFKPMVLVETENGEQKWIGFNQYKKGGMASEKG